MRRALIVSALTLVSSTSALGACVSEENVPPGSFDGGGRSPESSVPDVTRPVDATRPVDSATDVATPTEAAADAASDATTVDAATDATAVDAATDATTVDAATDATTVDATTDAPTDAHVGEDSGGFASLSLRDPRQNHTATLLTDGRVLFTGGWAPSNAGLMTAETYSTANGFTRITSPLTVGRLNHTATVLADGKVLLAGGSGTYDGGAGPLDIAEIFDPQTNTFTAVTARMTRARSLHGAARLADGRVLLVGGSVVTGTGDSSTDTAEIFDPGTDPVQGTFTATPTVMNARRMSPLVTELANGTVFIGAGRNGPNPPIFHLNTAETFDPANGGSFTLAAGTMSAGRTLATHTLLADGRVLIAGGYDGSQYVLGTEIYDPATRTFSAGPPLPSGRGNHAAGRLASGNVILAGGTGGSGAVDTAVIVRIGTSTVAPLAARLRAARALLSATTLADGRVMFAGGQMTSPSFITQAVDVFTE